MNARFLSTTSCFLLVILFIGCESSDESKRGKGKMLGESAETQEKGQQLSVDEKDFVEIWLLKVEESRVPGIAFSPDGKFLASTGRDAVTVWDWKAKGQTSKLTAPGVQFLCVTFSPDGRYLATGSEDHSVRVWDVSKKREVHRFDHGSIVTNLVFSPDSRFLLSAGFSAPVHVHDMERGKEAYAFEKQEGGTGRAAISPDGRTVASVHDYEHLCLWDLKTKDIQGRISSSKALLGAVAFFPDGKMLAYGCGMSIIILDLTTREELSRTQKLDGLILSLAFSPGGKYLFALSGYHFPKGETREWIGALRIYDARTLREIRCYRPKGGATKLALSPDGRVIAVSSDEWIILLETPKETWSTN